MSNILILIGISILSVISLLIIRKKGKKHEAISFIATLIATLIGVLLAVTLSNIESEKKERKDTIKLLNSANTIVEGTFEYVERIGMTIEQFEKDTITYSRSIIDGIKKEPLPYPDMMENIIANELVSKNVTEFSHSRIYNVLINLRKLNKFASIDVYKRFLQDLLLLIEIEIEYQKGKIPLKELNGKFNLGSEVLDEKYPYK